MNQQPRPIPTVVRRVASRLVAAAGIVLALALAAACSPGEPGPGPSTAPLPPSRPYCVGIDEGTYWAPPGGNGDEGGVLTVGSSARGVLLIPQSDGDICQWLPTGRRLAGRGYQVALMNWAQPFDQSVTTAYGRLQATGASQVVLIGASMGGAYALYLAADLHPAAVASFSGEVTEAGVDVEPQLERYHGPLLLVGSQNDHYDPAAMTRYLARKHPGPEQVVIVPGDDHGAALLTGDHRTQVNAALDTFLSQNLSR